jgi:hypothetical protein
LTSTGHPDPAIKPESHLDNIGSGSHVAIERRPKLAQSS